jgi:hypothetical protein
MDYNGNLDYMRNLASGNFLASGILFNPEANAKFSTAKSDSAIPPPLDRPFPPLGQGTKKPRSP